MITSKLKMQDGKVINPNITARVTNYYQYWEENKLLSNFELTNEFIKLGKENEGPKITRDRGVLKTPEGTKNCRKFNNTYWEKYSLFKSKSFFV